MNTNVDYFTTKFKNWDILIKLESIGEKLILAQYVNSINKEKINSSLFLNEVKKQLEEYFKGLRKEFNFNIEPSGTTKEIEVYNKLLNVKYGELKTYKDIAKEVKNPNASRFIGSTMRKNKIVIIVPCHRIKPTNTKDFGNYTFHGKEFKKELIKFEQNI